MIDDLVKLLVFDIVTLLFNLTLFEAASAVPEKNIGFSQIQ